MKDARLHVIGNQKSYTCAPYLYDIRTSLGKGCQIIQREIVSSVSTILRKVLCTVWSELRK